MCQNMAKPFLSGCPLQLLALGLLAMFFCASTVENEKQEDRRNQEKAPRWNETSSRPLPSSQDSENTPQKIHSSDSRNAWMLLMNNEVRSKKMNKNKSRKIKFGIPGLLEAAESAQPRPDTSTIIQEKLLREFQLLLKGIIRKQERINMKTTSKKCQHGEARDGKEENFFPQNRVPLIKSRERIEAAFHCQTQKNISVDRRSLQELQLYYIPKKEELFHRGLGLNLNNGQYMAPVSGYYIFSARLYVVPQIHPTKYQSRARDRLRLLICVESLCRQKSSLETVSSLDKASGYFTISVSGILFLQAGQYASVFIDNATGSSFIVRSGSDFRGVLLGI
ncbi:erythroferrone [Protobothrops mucrosquamatus]|uniref:erythroferrone n=1 Tax=Protobothrops mucrosquamatus TaxID=103944 RepID=UPI0010FB4343|nr:erythroferrone [Protobothrops mucrosquamatus]